MKNHAKLGGWGYMVKLSEREVKYLGENRWGRLRRRICLLGYLGTIAWLVAVTFLAPSWAEWPLGSIAVLVIALLPFVCFTGWWLKRVSRAGQQFLEQVKSESKNIKE